MTLIRLGRYCPATSTLISYPFVGTNQHKEKEFPVPVFGFQTLHALQEEKFLELTSGHTHVPDVEDSHGNDFGFSAELLL